MPYFRASVENLVKIQKIKLEKNSAEAVKNQQKSPVVSFKLISGRKHGRTTASPIISSTEVRPLGKHILPPLKYPGRSKHKSTIQLTILYHST